MVTYALRPPSKLLANLGPLNEAPSSFPRSDGLAPEQDEEGYRRTQETDHCIDVKDVMLEGQVGDQIGGECHADSDDRGEWQQDAMVACAQKTTRDLGGDEAEECHWPAERSDDATEPSGQQEQYQTRVLHRNPK